MRVVSEGGLAGADCEADGAGGTESSVVWAVTIADKTKAQIVAKTTLL